MYCIVFFCLKKKCSMKISRIIKKTCGHQSPHSGQRVKLGYRYVKVHKYTKYYYNLKQKNNYWVSITCGGWTFFLSAFIFLVLLKYPDVHAGTKYLLGILIKD